MKKPNILLLLPDQHRGDWIPLNETLPLEMPVFRRMMREGCLFENAFSPSPLCAPARACLASGRRYFRCGVRDNGQCYKDSIPTFYTALRNAGYSVGGVGKFDFHKPVLEWGLDGWSQCLRNMGFTHALDNAGKIDAVVSGRNSPHDPYMAELEKRGWREYHVEDMIRRGLKTHPTKLPEDLYCDNWICGNALDMIKSFPRDAPWFLQVNFTGPHQPFDVTERMFGIIAERSQKFPMPLCWTGNAEQALNVRRNYASMLENIDRLIGNILSFLDDTGVLSNTIVIYSSDHGEMLGDFNVFGKSRPEHPSVHIPLCAMGPGILPNRRVSALVELQDLASTFTDYADAGTDFEDSLSLRPILEGKADSCRDYVFSALVPETSVLKHHPDGWYMVFDGKWKLVSDSHGCECLYDMEAAQHEVAAADDDVRKCVMREIIERVVSNRKIPQGFVRG